MSLWEVSLSLSLCPSLLSSLSIPLCTFQAIVFKALSFRNKNDTVKVDGATPSLTLKIMEGSQYGPVDCVLDWNIQSLVLKDFTGGFRAQVGNPHLLCSHRIIASVLFYPLCFLLIFLGFSKSVFPLSVSCRNNWRGQKGKGTPDR